MPTLPVSALLLPPLLAAAPTPQDLAVELVADGFDRPSWVGGAPGDPTRLFVIEKDLALVRVLRGGALLPEPFLDLSDRVSGFGERGLLGLAFHPDYASNGRFFVDYTDLAGDTVVAEYRRSADPNRADPDAVQVLFQQVQPFSNHNGGCLAFGPDGLLYVGMGDGGQRERPERKRSGPGYPAREAAAPGPGPAPAPRAAGQSLRRGRRGGGVRVGARAAKPLALRLRR